MITMAVFLAGSLVLNRPGLYREARFHPNLERFGPFQAPVAGAAFGFGWQPCLGPILAAVCGCRQQGARNLDSLSSGNYDSRYLCRAKRLGPEHFFV